MNLKESWFLVLFLYLFSDLLFLLSDRRERIRGKKPVRNKQKVVVLQLAETFEAPEVEGLISGSRDWLLLDYEVKAEGLVNVEMRCSVAETLEELPSKVRVGGMGKHGADTSGWKDDEYCFLKERVLSISVRGD